MIKKHVFTCVLTGVLLLCWLPFFFAFSGSKKAELLQSQTIIAEGFIRVYGNEPHTYIGLVLDDGTAYTLDGKEEVLQKLRLLQGIRISVTGIIEHLRDGAIPPAEVLAGGVFHVQSVKVIK